MVAKPSLQNLKWLPSHPQTQETKPDTQTQRRNDYTQAELSSFISGQDNSMTTPNILILLLHKPLDTHNCKDVLKKNCCIFCSFCRSVRGPSLTLLPNLDWETASAGIVYDLLSSAGSDDFSAVVDGLVSEASPAPCPVRRLASVCTDCEALVRVLRGTAPATSGTALITCAPCLTDMGAIVD